MDMSKEMATVTAPLPSHPQFKASGLEHFSSRKVFTGLNLTLFGNPRGQCSAFTEKFKGLMANLLSPVGLASRKKNIGISLKRTKQMVPSSFDLPGCLYWMGKLSPETWAIPNTH